METIKLPCKYSDCENYLDVIVKNLTTFSFDRQFYVCSRDCLEKYLNSGGMMIRRIPPPPEDPDHENYIDDETHIKLTKMINERIGQIHFFKEDAQNRAESSQFKRKDKEFLLNSLGSKELAYKEMRRMIDGFNLNKEGKKRWETNKK